MKEIVKIIRSAKVKDWDLIDQKNFYELIKQNCFQEDSLHSQVRLFNIMMCTHKPDITWLDEIAEALRNCANGCDYYLIDSMNEPDRPDQTLKKFIEET